MRLLVRIIVGLISTVVLFGAGIIFWFFFYSVDLPDIQALAHYSPVQVSRVSDPCLGESTAIPSDAIGDYLRLALDTAEGDATVEQHHGTNLSMQISRGMFCTPSKMLGRELKELRASVEIKRQFSARDLLTIYANRIRFEDNLVGVESVSERYFQKEPNQLEIAEAALLAGLVERPSYYSPFKHPDRALQRRNSVIDAMVESHAISPEQGSAAKATRITIAATISQTESP
jgi:membrane carboxypeptidase/penicillin-binding protein